MARVLVVDDHAANRELVVTLLRYRGHDTFEAADGAEGLRQVRTHRPDLVISDILMPTMDGFEFVRELRGDPELERTQVLFYTAYYHEREARALARACGVSRVLLKPAEPEEFLAAIDAVFRGGEETASSVDETGFGREHVRLMTDKLAEKVEELTAANGRLSALGEVNVHLASEQDPQALMAKVCQSARELLGASFAVVCVRERDGDHRPFCVTAGIDPVAVEAAGKPPVDDPVMTTVLRERRALRIDNPSGDPRRIGLPAGYPCATSALVAPICSLHRDYGWICLGGKLGSDAFDEEDERILATLGAQVGRIYENGSLYAEMRRSAERLGESEQRFRQIAENIREVFWLTDPSKNQMLYVSPAYEEVWGRDVEALSTSPVDWVEAIHPEDRERVLENARTQQATGRYAEEYRIVRPDGAVRWIFDRAFPVLRDGQVYRIAGIAEDITEQKRARDELRESERRFRDMLGNVELVSLMLDRNGHILYCNDFLLRLTGWERDELIGQDWFELFIPQDAEVRGVFEGLIRDDPETWHHDNAIITRMGERRTIRWNNTVLRAPGGEIIGTASVGEDVTERQRVEAEVRRLYADLERRVAERTAELEAVNRELEAFDYSVSHDLRAPLNHIQGFTDLLLEKHGSKFEPAALDLVRRVANAGKRMEQIVGDLFALSTVARGELQRRDVDVSALVHSVAEALRRGAPQHAVELQVEAGMRANADPGLLRAVLENLLGNAWKFTAKRQGARVEVGTERHDGRLTFFVRDNGAGFDPAQASRLFAPFQRLHPASQFAGTGVGLATVERIVRRHGGRVSAEGTPGAGATFRFTLQP
ncbi:MAG TPA: PAS domain S-box protein [Usitatibacter sp.]|jgi:PAS domain S-box-containing protein|nr:PAS domain S-box protein [Usitatibacter sp.]